MSRRVPVLASALTLTIALTLLAVAHAGDQPKNPLENARVGQWVRYKLPRDLEQRQTVTKIDGKKITIKCETILDGTVAASTETVVDLEAQAPVASDAKPEDAKVSEVTLEVKGKKLACRLTATATEKTWTSADVPLRGIVRVESNGVVVQELLDWGDPAPAKEKP